MARAFTLVKWYLDPVTDAGETAILYCADLRWRGVHATAASYLCLRDGTVEARTLLCRYQLRLGGDRISVEVPPLAIAGSWQAAALPVEHVVFENSEGEVLWKCLQPASAVEAKIGGRNWSGAGYAECLTLTVRPWKLPLEELRWGRFVSARDSLVWIDWVGSYSTRLLFHNGVACEAQTIDDARIVWPGGSLSMQQSFPLRSGRLSATLFPSAPALSKLLPRSLANIEEHKWRSHGILQAGEHEIDGWAIHEVVRWNP